MAALDEQIDLRHHAADVHPGRRRVHCNCAAALRANFLSDTPHLSAVDLAHRVLAMPASSGDNGNARGGWVAARRRRGREHHGGLRALGLGELRHQLVGKDVLNPACRPGGILF